MKKVVLTLCLMFLSGTVFPCLIFMLTDGSRILIGNHEDWPARDARIKFIPASAGRLGALAFDFASEGLIQGGMNTAGFFFDGTATPFAPLDFSDKEDFKGKDFWLTLLQSCTTVSEAVTFIKKYKVPELEKVHLFFADRFGESVIVGAYDGNLTFTHPTNRFQLLTNFNIVDPEYGGEQPCPRFATATKILASPGKDPIETARGVLQQTTQGQLTVYSSIYDLRAGTVTVFSEGDFSRSRTFQLDSELKLGSHALLVSELIK